MFRYIKTINGATAAIVPEAVSAIEELPAKGKLDRKTMIHLDSGRYIVTGLTIPEVIALLGDEVK